MNADAADGLFKVRIGFAKGLSKEKVISDFDESNFFFLECLGESLIGTGVRENKRRKS